jgi:DNA-binding NtrC family response regulator
MQAHAVGGGKPVSNGTILVVEDHANEREALVRILREEHYDVSATADAPAALDHLHAEIDLVISDVRMKGLDGFALLHKWKRRRPSTPFILTTAYGEAPDAVRALKAGADHFLAKPVKPRELLLVVRDAIHTFHRLSAHATLANPVSKVLGFEKIVGDGAAMDELCTRLRRASRVDSSVLITGESGTGKELFAQGIHYNSPRRHAPFITVNMAAVPEALVESELFGHVRGAFTGASDTRIGKFEAANGGTLFIDEIGDFAEASQAKLLRVLENHEITQVGGNDEREIDVRVVAATSRDLPEMVANGDFRADLYFRLDVIHLHLPPLRDRRDEIPLLVNHFLQKLCETIGRKAPKVDRELMDYFVEYEWPGNIRQLKNCLESMAVLAEGDVLTKKQLPASASLPRQKSRIQIPRSTSLQELERAAIAAALAENHDNRTCAARTLGISLRTLQRKLKQHLPNA